ncbi:hypothetical protein Sjap_014231 [Stephania japonica]|uniref:Uncharacterized protein n=1 Tax=Stephania japonica TaxID=461633 RepID=A0AAP0NZS7_9MAGN
MDEILLWSCVKIIRYCHTREEAWNGPLGFLILKIHSLLVPQLGNFVTSILN